MTAMESLKWENSEQGEFKDTVITGFSKRECNNLIARLYLSSYNVYLSVYNVCISGKGAKHLHHILSEL